jgi:hypothetical protein
MAIAHSQDWAAVGSTSAVSSLQNGAAGSPLTSGSTILVFIWHSYSGGGRTVSGIIDTAGNSYAKDAGAAIVTNFPGLEVWRAQNTQTTASNKITVSLAGGTAFLGFAATEFTGLVTTSPLDGAGSSNTGTAGTNTPSTGAFSTSNANDLLVACFGSDGTSSIPNEPTAAGTWANVGKLSTGGTKEDGSADYVIVSSTQTSINPTWTSVAGTSRWTGLALAYKALTSPYTVTAPGGFTFVAQSTSVQFEGIGGGQNGVAGGVSLGSAGGAGGAYAKKLVAGLTIGATYSGNVGAAGATGGDTWFDTTAIAQAIGGGSSNSNVGDVVNAGGAAGAAGTTGGGGGGGSGGTLSAGNPGGNGSVATGGTGGAAVTGGGAGGNGGNAASSGTNATAPGGGGGGGGSGSSADGLGAPGQVTLTWPVGGNPFAGYEDATNTMISYFW